MKTLADVQVGDEIYITERYTTDSEPRLVKVSKIGRKYITVEVYGRPSAFDKETGIIHDDYGHSIISTVEQYAYKCKVTTAVTELRKYGIELSNRFKGDVLEVYERLLPTFDKTV